MDDCIISITIDIGLIKVAKQRIDQRRKIDIPNDTQPRSWWLKNPDTRMRNPNPFDNIPFYGPDYYYRHNEQNLYGGDLTDEKPPFWPWPPIV